MRLNKFFTIATTALTALFAASCSDSDNDYAAGEWNASANYANVYFETASSSETIEPSAPTTTTIEVHRRNTAGALTVPFKVLKNTDGVFTVGDAVFADGEDVATAEVSFPNAEIGKSYTLQVTFDDPTLVSYYSSDITYSYSVIRAKWNLLGTGVFSDTFWFEDSWEVEIYQRDDDNSYFRIMHPFDVWADDLDGNQSEYLELHVTKAGDQINGITMSEAGIVDWSRICTGYFHSTYEADVWALHPQNFTSASVNTYDVYQYNRVVAYLEDGKTPGKIQLAPYWYMFGVGGWNYTTEPTIFITFPGYVEEYTATPEDYDWDALFTGDFVSEQLGTSTSGVTLYQGKRKAEVEEANPGCYDRFETLYGTTYMIESPYAEGKNLYFCVRDGKVLVPSGYESQDLGFKAVGVDVYGKITAGESSYTEGVEVALGITFQNQAGTIEYGTAIERLQHVTWTAVGTGTYTYTTIDYTGQYGGLWEGTQEATLYACDQNASRFKIAPWADQQGEAGLVFTVDADDNIVVDGVETGMVDEEYGMVYATDLITYDAANIASYLKDGVYYFALAYHDSEGPWAYVQDTFTLNAAAPAAKKAAKNHRAGVLRHSGGLKSAFNSKVQSRQQRINARFVAKKASKKLPAPVFFQ